MAEQFTFADAVSARQNGVADLDSVTNALLTQLTMDERLSLLDGCMNFTPNIALMDNEAHNRGPLKYGPLVYGVVERLGIPGIRFVDGPQGWILGYFSTIFPAPMTRGATWDVDLEERIGIAIGREYRAQDINIFGGVFITLPQYLMGRNIQDTYTEDPVLLGEMAAALTRGLKRNIMPCVKHLAIDSGAGEEILHEVHLAPLKRVVEEGVSAVISCSPESEEHRQKLLLRILRDQWNFKGVVMSDFAFGVRDALLSLRNGLDIETRLRSNRVLYLTNALVKEEISRRDVNAACMNILRSQIDLAATRDIDKPNIGVVMCGESDILTREAAVKSMVLMKNQRLGGKPMLPLSSGIKKLAVIGRLAGSTLAGGPSVHRQRRRPEINSIRDGLIQALPDTQVELRDGRLAKKIAQNADLLPEVAVVVIVACARRDYTQETEGPQFRVHGDVEQSLPPDDHSEEAQSEEDLSEESSDVENSSTQGSGVRGNDMRIRLRFSDICMIQAAHKENPCTVVVVVAPGPVTTEGWENLANAIVWQSYATPVGGQALADLLLGKENFAGRLPISILDEKEGVRYPIGFGKSYTSFCFSKVEVEGPTEEDPEGILVKVAVSNTGSCSGRVVVQVYGCASGASSHAKKRSLLGFKPIDLTLGEERLIEMNASIRPLLRWRNGQWKMEMKEVELEVGEYAGDKDSCRETLVLSDQVLQKLGRGS